MNNFLEEKEKLLNSIENDKNKEDILKIFGL